MGKIVDPFDSGIIDPLDAQEPLKIGADAFPDALRQTLREADWGTRNIAGAGTALSGIVEGAKQLVGMGDKRAIDANRIISEEAPVGSFAGNVATAAVPFGLAGPSLKAAGSVGAGLGLLSPVDGENILQGKAINTVMGGALGAGGQAVANKTGQMLANRLSALQAMKSQRGPIDATIKEALDAGYVIPPGQVNPSFFNRQIESMGGKIATQQMASSKNQTITDTLARKAAGLMPDEPITPETLRAARDVIKRPYQDIAALGLQPKLDAIDAARAEANAAWREYSRQGTRAALNDYKAFSQQGKAIEQEIERDLLQAKQPDLMQQFRKARIALAKNHDVESALIEGGGTIDARAIGRMFQRGDKMTGDLKTIGAFANNFGKDIQPPSMIGTPDAHNLKYILSGALGAGGGMSDDPRMAALGLLPLLSGPAARSAMFSKAMQGGLVPSYSLGLPVRAIGSLLGNTPIAGTVSGLNAFGQ